MYTRDRPVQGTQVPPRGITNPVARTRQVKIVTDGRIARDRLRRPAYHLRTRAPAKAPASVTKSTAAP
jgi:hypothetical protein